MSVDWAPLTAGDLRKCTHLWNDRQTYTAREFETAVHRLAGLLEEGRALGALVFESGVVRAFGVTVFAHNDALAALLDAPHPQIGKRLLLTGAPLKADGILARSEIAAANRGSGVNVVTVNANYSQDSIDHAAVLGAIMASFQAVHRGYRVARIVNEIHGPACEDVVASGLYELKYRFSDVAGVAGLQSVIGSLTREHAAEKRSPFLGLFLYGPPKVCFTEAEQELLRAALGGHPDSVLADVLRIPVSTVKGRWRRLQERSFQALPDHFGHLHAIRPQRRGAQIRHVILAYVRQHPSELTPYRSP